MRLTGELLAETYQVGDLLGSGGMGDVYEAFHTRLHRRLAIKILHPRFAREPETFARFRREAHIAGELGHPHIVEIIDFNTMPDGAPYIVMERLEGEDLAARIDRLGKIPIETVLRVADQVGSALSAAHAKSVVHRDLKPQNIFLCSVEEDHWYAKILDFGISKIRGSTSVITQDHVVLGTPNYMSPEQAEGRTDLTDERTDQFALAVILYEMMTGRTPFEGDTLPSVLYQVVHGTPPPVHEVDPAISPIVGMALNKAMAKSPADRFPKVRSFVRALRGVPEDVETDRIVANPPAPPGGEAAPAAPLGTAETVLGDTGDDLQPNRGKKTLLIGAAAALALVGGGVALILGLSSSSDPERQAEAAEAQPEPPAPAPTPPPEEEPAAAEADEPEPITVRFSSRPRADRVLVDGQEVEGESLALPGDGAAHKVRFEKEGYEPEEIDFTADESQVLRVRMHRADAPKAEDPERSRAKRRAKRKRARDRSGKPRRKTDETRRKAKESGGFILDL